MLVEQTTMSQGLNDNKSSRIREIVSSNYVAILDEAILLLVQVALQNIHIPLYRYTFKLVSIRNDEEINLGNKQDLRF